MSPSTKIVLYFLVTCLLESKTALDFQARFDIEEPLLYDTFPANFQWGVATSAYQIEGGWNEGGKGLSIWDVFTQNASNTEDGSNGNIACDSYHRYPEDIQLIKEMNGINRYRFSIAWSRVLPLGTGEVNQQGLDYYNNVIDELIANEIEPIATLYHWDLPQALQEKGGWQSPDSPQWFQEYADICYQAFGDRVKMWMTINEPGVVAIAGHGLGVHAPGIKEPGIADYQVGHNLILAHAKAYNVYHEKYAANQKGRVGIVLNSNWYEPEDPDNPNHLQASETKLQFTLGWFANPILVNGKYPDIMREQIDLKSQLQGFPTSRLPVFTEEESADIAGTVDFVGINHYSSSLVYPTPPEDIDLSDVSWFADSDVTEYKDHRWYSGATESFKVVPFGLRKLVGWVSRIYGSEMDIYVTENGFSDLLGNLDDLHRVYYFKHYLNQLLKAVRLDCINVRGYFAWSLLDNFEWGHGYVQKYGIHSVDMASPERSRAPKASSKFLSRIAADNGFLNPSSETLESIFST